MQLLGQIDSGGEVVDKAISHSWEAGAVALILLVMVWTIGWMLKAVWRVNQRLAERVTTLESQFTDRLLVIVDNTSTAIAANTAMLERTSGAIGSLEQAVEKSLHTQEAILNRIESSPCLMEREFSQETRDRLARARQAAKGTQVD